MKLQQSSWAQNCRTIIQNTKLDSRMFISIGDKWYFNNPLGSRIAEL